MVLIELIESFIYVIKEALGIDTKYFNLKSKYRKCSTLKCKRMSSELKRHSFISESEYLKLYQYARGVYAVYIFNDELAKTLYTSLSSKKGAIENLPLELKRLSFTEEKKQNAIRFITFNYSEFGDIKSMLGKFYDICNCFCDTFSCEKRIHINYTTFFENALKADESFLASLMLSISLEEYVLDYDKLTNIISVLLDLYSNTSFEDLKEHLLNVRSDIARGFYNYKAGEFYTELSESMELNILKLIVNKNCFDDYKKFFYESPFEGKWNLIDEKVLIFDEEVFEKCLERACENDNFVWYESKYDMYSWLKIKDPKNNQNMRNVLEGLIEKDLLFDSEIIFAYSLQSDNCYIRFYHGHDHIHTLRDYIRLLRYCQNSRDKMMSELIILINNTFKDNLSAINSICFDENIDFLDYFYVSKNTKKLCLSSIFNIDCDKRKNNKFSYPVVIMEAVKFYLKEYQIGIEKIYECGFMKMFPVSFAIDLINYLKTGEYSPKDITKKLKGILQDKDYDRIVFLENIPLDNSELIEKITLVSKTWSNEIVSNINQVKSSINAANVGRFQNASYISLDEYMNNVLPEDNLTLSSNELKKLFRTFEFRDLVLKPKKIIVSKDYIEGDNYQIIGIIWNKSKLYSLSELIKNKAINTPELYQVIASVLNINKQSGYSVIKLGHGISDLLVDDKLKVVFNSTLFKDEKSIIESRKDEKRIYSAVMHMVKGSFDSFLEESFTYFSYDELAKSPRYKKRGSIAYVLNNLELCEAHNKWHLEGSMCSCCEKVYEVDSYSFKNKLHLNYSSTVSSFYERTTISDGSGHYGYFTSINQDNIRLGIENGLYDKFKYFIPRKIILSSYRDDSSKSHNVSCISYDLYDFSNVVELSYFKSVQRIKMVLLLYNKILPHILDGSFIVDRKNVFQTIFVDKTKKGEILISGLVYLRSDVILSSDEDLKKQYVEITKKRFSEFLEQYITNDSSLKLELENRDTSLEKILDDIRNCGFTEKYVKEYLQRQDSFCNIHKEYFSSKNVLCPECIKSGIDKNKALIIKGDYLKTLKSKKPEFEGGEANLYMYTKEEVQKIFNDDVDRNFKVRIIGKTLQKQKLFEEFNKQNKDVQFVPINTVLFSFENNVLNLEGYTENIIKDAFKISSLKDRAFVKQLGYTRKDIIQILINLCKGIEFLHSIGGFIGDLNGGNVLIKDKVVYIIDFDGMSFDDVKNYVYTNMYIYPPSAENKNITKDDDWYSFAVQAFYYLTYSHPFRGVCSDSKVPENEIERMKLGLSVLGNHGIVPPSMSSGWDFMTKELTNFFLRTFEGKKRDNMADTLKRFLEYAMQNELKFKEIERNRKVKKILGEDLYVDLQNNLVYKEEVMLDLGKYNDWTFRNFCNKFIAIFGEQGTVIFDNNTGSFYETEESYYNNSKKPVFAQRNKIYYTVGRDLSSPGGIKLFVDEIDAEAGKISHHRINKATGDEIYSLIVTEEDKFVFIEENLNEHTLDIYCNMMNICKVPESHFRGTIRITELYDDISGKWLFLLKDDEKTTGIVVDKNNQKHYYDFEINHVISDGISFYNNVLYYPGDGKVCYYNVNNGKLNSIDCDVVTSGSIVQRKDNKFIIINNDASYMYFKS